MALFPNVPDFPGVPPLLRDPSVITNAIRLLITDAVEALLFFANGPQWGVFLYGIPVLEPDSILTFGFKQEWSISDYPVEDGGFQSYNKVALPFDVRVRMAKGGDDFERRAFIDSVRLLAPTLFLLDIVTPEEIYLNCNIHHWDYEKRAQSGVSLIQVELWLTEVRVTATAVFTSTQSPADAGQQSAGNVQAVPVPSTTAASGPSGGFMAERFGNWQ
jgi:hypothetical protein